LGNPGSHILLSRKSASVAGYALMFANLLQ
jgi:hypothetical protein